MTLSVAATLVIATALLPGHALADDPTAPETKGSTSNGFVDVSASSSPMISSGSGGGPVCTWQWLTVGDVLGLGGQSSSETNIDPAAKSVTIKNGIEYRVYAVSCPGGGTSLRLVNPNQSPGLIRDRIFDHASRLIEMPVPNINPAPEHDSYVNLGLWLAIQPVDYGTLTAEAGPAWITVTPTLATTTYDFGNGDHVTCEATGTPISNLDTIEQGPCGYTYTQPGDYRLSITSTWELPYTSSSGSGSLDPIERTLTVDYHVKEIQTVGVNG